jgi:hypothetical protein
MSNEQEQGSTSQSTSTPPTSTPAPVTDQVPGRILDLQRVQDSFDRQNIIVKNKLED